MYPFVRVEGENNVIKAHMTSNGRLCQVLDELDLRLEQHRRQCLKEDLKAFAKIPLRVVVFDDFLNRLKPVMEAKLLDEVRHLMLIGNSLVAQSLSPDNAVQSLCTFNSKFILL